MYNLNGGTSSTRTVGRSGATGSASTRTRSSEKSGFRRKMQTNRNPNSSSNPRRVSDGALTSAISLTKSVKSGSAIVTKAGGVRKAKNIPASVPRVQSAYVVPSSSLAASSIKKSSLSRKSAGGIPSANYKIAAKSINTGARKVKFSANVHTFPPTSSSNNNNNSSTSSKKKKRISTNSSPAGELQLRKRVKKLKNKTSGGDQSVSDRINLSVSQFPPQPSTILKSSIHHHGAIVDVEEPVTTKPRKNKPKVSAQKKATAVNKVKKIRIKAGSAIRQPVPSGYTRPSPRLAYSIPLEARRSLQSPVGKAKNQLTSSVPFR